MKKHVQNTIRKKYNKKKKDLLEIEDIRYRYFLCFDWPSSINDEYLEKIIKDAKEKLRLNLSNADKNEILTIIDKTSSMLGYADNDYLKYNDIIDPRKW